MTNRIRLGNGFDFIGRSGNELLDATVIETNNQQLIMPEYTGYKSLLDFTMEEIINPDQKYGTRYANNGLREKQERGNKERRSIDFSPKKGIYQREYAGEFEITETLQKWLETSNTIEGAPMGVQAELVDIQDQVQDLVDAYDMTKADILVNVWTQGNVMTNPNGPGSANADGEALFGDHTIQLEDGATVSYNNLNTDSITYDFTDAGIQSGVTALQNMLNTLKTVVLNNGRKVRQPGGKGYNLYCSRQNETYWRAVLNDGSGYSGRGDNAAEMNQFNFQNNMVNLMVIDTLGDTSATFNSTVGSNDLVFLTNPDYIRRTKCFKCFELTAPIIKTYMNDSTDIYYTSLKCYFGADHFNEAERGIIANGF